MIIHIWPIMWLSMARNDLIWSILVFMQRAGKIWITCENTIEKVHYIKSSGQIKIDSEFMVISFVFWPHFGPKLTSLEQALPRGLRAHLYAFGITRARKMG